jgi:hypothetical protein
MPGFNGAVRGRVSQDAPGLVRLARGSRIPSSTATDGPAAGIWASVGCRKPRGNVP